jgi:uncharacterized protein (TIGR03382 family)
MRISSLVAFGAAVITSNVAFADIPPPDRCPHDANPGTACNTDSGKEGTCVEKTRSHYLPPDGDGEPKAVESKYMGCVEKAAAVTSAPTSPPDASSESKVPAAPPSSKRGCNSSGSGTTSLLGASLVAGLLWKLSRRRSTNK